eukprot:6153458-Pyramimonas_sp.AAC.1
MSFDGNRMGGFRRVGARIILLDFLFVAGTLRRQTRRRGGERVHLDGLGVAARGRVGRDLRGADGGGAPGNTAVRLRKRLRILRRAHNLRSLLHTTFGHSSTPPASCPTATPTSASNRVTKGCARPRAPHQTDAMSAAHQARGGLQRG